MTLEPLIARYGLLVVFLGAGLEGETAAAIDGMLAHRGTLAYGETLAAAFLGSFLADQTLFALGRLNRDGGMARRLRARPGFDRALTLMARRPLPFAFGFRFIPGMRTVGPLAIGASGLAPLRFAAINAAAAAIWAALFVSAGYWLGQGLFAVFGRIEPLERLLLPVLAALALVCCAIWLARRRRRSS